MNHPNDRQVGGAHYRRNKVQHWDVMLALECDYFVGVATKYLDRYMNKANPVQDLEKAMHYLQKYSLSVLACPGYDEAQEQLLDAYLDQFEAGGYQRMALDALLNGHVALAMSYIEELIAETKASQPSPRGYVDQD